MSLVFSPPWPGGQCAAKPGWGPEPPLKEGPGAAGLRKRGQRRLGWRRGGVGRDVGDNTAPHR